MTATGTLMVNGYIRVGTNSPPLVNTGTFTIDGGNVHCSMLKIEGDHASRFLFPSGTLTANFVSVTNGTVTVVGNGTDFAVLNLGGGESCFSGGLAISSNATLTGSGTVHGWVENHGTVCPTGTMLFTNNGQFCGNVTNYGTLAMTNGGALAFGGTVDNHARPNVESIVWAPINRAGLWVRTVGGLTNVLEHSTGPNSPWVPVREWIGTGECVPVSGDYPGFYRVRVDGMP
jgi:hypothetical protein